MDNSKTIISQQQKKYIDADTGEVILVDQITKHVRGIKEFWKVCLMDFLAVLGICDSKQLDIFIYIVMNTSQATNLFVGTYKKIAAEVNVSEPTIAKIMKKLQENNFIRRVQNGVWRVNPAVLMKGDERKRQMLLTYYESDEPSLTREKIALDEPVSVLQLPSGEEKEVETHED